MAEPILTKVCYKCQEVKLITEFHKDISKPDGLMYICKICRKSQELINENQKERKKQREKIYRENNPDKIKQYQKAYREKNREQHKLNHKKYYNKNKKFIIEKSRKWNLENKDKRKLWYDKYKHENKEKIKKRSKLYYNKNKNNIIIYNNLYRKNNKEKVNQSIKKWRYKNPEKSRLTTNKNNHKRRALRLKVTIEDFSHKEVFERDGYICQICGRKTRPDFRNQYHPLYPNLDHILPLSKGGAHSRHNTQCLCRKCNMEKNNKTNFGDQLRLFG